MLRIAFVSLLLIATMFPTAAAASCAPAAATVAAAGGFYVTSAPGVWSESNGQPGLQTSAGSCTDDNGRDHAWAADTQVV